jgi:hypothetical protein
VSANVADWQHLLRKYPKHALFILCSATISRN